MRYLFSVTPQRSGVVDGWKLRENVRPHKAVKNRGTNHKQAVQVFSRHQVRFIPASMSAHLAYLRRVHRKKETMAARRTQRALQHNPMTLVRVKDSSERQREPKALTVEEFRKVLEYIPEPFRTMCVVAMCLGLRVSEILGLRWLDSCPDGIVGRRNKLVTSSKSSKSFPWSFRPQRRQTASRFLFEYRAGSWTWRLVQIRKVGIGSPSRGLP